MSRAQPLLLHAAVRVQKNCVTWQAVLVCSCQDSMGALTYLCLGMIFAAASSSVRKLLTSARQRARMWLRTCQHTTARHGTAQHSTAGSKQQTAQHSTTTCQCAGMWLHLATPQHAEFEHTTRHSTAPAHISAWARM
jgi:hypothetical protein